MLSSSLTVLSKLEHTSRNGEDFNVLRSPFRYMKQKIQKISEDAMLSKMLELGMIKKVDCGYVQAYDEDGRLWSKKRASMTLSIQFGYRANAHHVSTGFLKKFNKMSEEHMIRWEWLKNDPRVLPPRQDKRRECELELGFDPERCPLFLRLNIQKRWLVIQRTTEGQKRIEFIDRYRDFLKRHHPYIFPEECSAQSTRQTESLESMLATSGALFGHLSSSLRWSNGNCYDNCQDGQSYDE